MQGTGDQHISYQQVLAKPERFLPFFISFVPEKLLPGFPAVGFAKGHLNHISPHMVRDYFAEASYEALTLKRRYAGGEGVFLRMLDSKRIIQSVVNQALLNSAFPVSVYPKSIKEPHV
jgi:hypothetical protein